MDGSTVLLVIVLLFVLLVGVSVVKAVQIIPQAQAAVVERLGRYQKTLKPGLAFLVPFIDRIRAWPAVPRGTDWKTGVCAALGWGDPADGARRVLGAVCSYRDLETPLIGAVERLIDFVTVGDACP